MTESIYERTVQKLSSAGIQSPRLEARLLIAHLLKIDINTVHSSVIIPLKLQEKLEQNIFKRLRGMPLDKILGHKGFYKYDFMVSENVLSPRPETEILVEEALNILKENHVQTVADFGVGSGCILLSLLQEIPLLKGVGIDASKEALKIARKNAKELTVESRCKFIHKSWFDEDFSKILEQKFDVIVSNPPYIRTEQIQSLDVEVKKYDPLLALDGGTDGLKDYRRIAEIMPEVLNQNGYLLLEIGQGQAQKVRHIFENVGLKYQKTMPDYAGIDRVLVMSLG